jgi:hypothetical protein
MLGSGISNSLREGRIVDFLHLPLCMMSKFCSTSLIYKSLVIFNRVFDKPIDIRSCGQLPSVVVYFTHTLKQYVVFFGIYNRVC